MGKLSIAVIGMAVMGRNLALNLADHGFTVGVYNRSYAASEAAVTADQTGRLHAFSELSELIAALERPRKILMLIKAGEPVDQMLAHLRPLLDPGDIVADCGNSYFSDSERRAEEMAAADLHFLGIGVSGGEEGARFGPAIMPGGDRLAYEALSPMLEAISAKAEGDPCCAYTARGGAGHYVKMVHNGIEYADMQIIAEAYALLRAAGLQPNAMAEIFRQFNEGALNSYLIEITATVLNTRDDLAPGYLIDQIVDRAEQKGTGQWTNLEAVKLELDASVLLAGLNARVISNLKAERETAERLYKDEEVSLDIDETLLEDLESALLAAKIIAYAQGFALYRQAAEVYDWNLDYAKIAGIFRNGCIIRAGLLREIMASFRAEPDLRNLLLAPDFVKLMREHMPGLRRIVALAAQSAIAAPALSAALSYFDSYSTAEGSANLIQGLRDHFGAHQYERRDRSGSYHYPWPIEYDNES